MNVAIIGGGNGGQAAAGALSLAGHRVCIHDIDQATVAPIAQSGGILVSGPVVAGFAQIDYAGTELGRAVEGAELILVIVPGQAQAAAVAALAPHVRDDTCVLLHPGCTGGALECSAALRHAGCSAPVGETDSFVYACRLVAPGKTHIAAVKAQVRLGVLPTDATKEVAITVRRAIPQIEEASSVLETSLANMNSMLHVGPMLTNVGRIENRSYAFEFYGDGITPSVARLVTFVDEERLGVCKALDVPCRSLATWIRETYGISGASLHETIVTLNRDVYKSSPAPTTLEHRYLTEDVAVGLVPLEALGHGVGLEMELTGALITIASNALARDFRLEGRTAKRMGLAGLDVDGIRRFIATGRLDRAHH